MEQKNYLETIYSKGNTPITDYPKKFIIYLIKRFEIKKKQKVLEIGCGRGEFLNEFVNNGLEGYGVDISNYCKEFFPNINFKKVSLYIVRVDHNNSLKSSAPCVDCMKHILRLKIKRIIYSNGNGELTVQNPLLYEIKHVTTGRRILTNKSK